MKIRIKTGKIKPCCVNQNKLCDNLVRAQQSSSNGYCYTLTQFNHTQSVVDGRGIYHICLILFHSILIHTPTVENWHEILKIPRNKKNYKNKLCETVLGHPQYNRLRLNPVN